MTDGYDVPRKAEYGFDAGYLLPLAAAACIAMLVLAVMSRSLVPSVFAGASLFFVGSGLHASRRGKFLVWEEVIDGLRLRGDERVLDLGCGRGAVLLSVAKRLTSGRGFGVDIWSRIDQSGLRSTRSAGMRWRRGSGARRAADGRHAMALPFPADAFDVMCRVSRPQHPRAARSGRRRSTRRCASCVPAADCWSRICRTPDGPWKRLVELGM
jgi:SAM-dependent methyltransferase